jgi:hypothetical protein
MFNRALECPICNNSLFTNSGVHVPLSFRNCGHTICSSCADQLKTQINENACLSCPTCTTLSDVPLPKNFPLIDLLNALSQSASQESKSADSKVGDEICDLCQAEPFSHYCSQCEAYICARCNISTHRLKATSLHRPSAVFSRATTSEQSPIAHNVNTTCVDHPGRPLEMFCRSEPLHARCSSRP